MIPSRAADADADELVGFLRADDRKVKAAAVESFEGLSAVPPESLQPLISEAFASLFDIVRAFAADAAEAPVTVRGALASLCNLCLSSEDSALRSLSSSKHRDHLDALLAVVLAGVGVRRCQWGGCSHHGVAVSSAQPRQEMKRCSRCRCAWYCGAECAKLHWKAAHRSVCQTLVGWSAGGVPDISAKLAFLAATLLNNLTRSQALCEALVSATDEDAVLSAVPAVCAVLIEARTPAETVASALGAVTNLAQSGRCRSLFVSGPRPPLALLIGVLREEGGSPMVRESAEMRRSICGAIRNVCFSGEIHERLLSQELDVLTFLLSRIRGDDWDPSEDDKKTLPKPLWSRAPLESDLECRKLVLEALLQLVCKSATRLCLLECNAYVVLKEYDSREKDEDVKAKVVDIVDLLIRDPRSTIGKDTTAPLPPQSSSQAPPSEGSVIEEI